MCLCWNDDGSICSPEELKHRMDLYNRGLYKPELRALRERLKRERYESPEYQKRLSYIMEKYKDYKWPWSKENYDSK